MVFKKFNKARSIFNSFAALGLATTALFCGANTLTANAATIDKKTDDTAVNAPAGGATNKFLDFTGNGRTDFVTLGLTAGGPISWHVLGNPASAVPNQSFIRRFDYGLADSDDIVVGDYVGDNKAELAVYRTTTTSAPGYFYLAQFPNGAAGVTLDRAVQWGNGLTDTSGGIGDYDGDGKVDYTVVRVIGTAASNNIVWFIMSSSTNTMRTVYFGSIPPTGADLRGTAIFNGADFTGDGRDELVIVNRTAAGAVNYYAGDSITGAGVLTRTFGNYNSDYSFTPADYTGDGKADLVACRQTNSSGNSIWYIFNSATGVTTGTSFGIADPTFDGNGDVPLRGDYDGDNRHDIAVWRPSNQTFYYLSTRFNNVQSQYFGDPDDTPLGSFGLY